MRSMWYMMSPNLKSVQWSLIVLVSVGPIQVCTYITPQTAKEPTAPYDRSKLVQTGPRKM